MRLRRAHGQQLRHLVEVQQRLHCVQRPAVARARPRLAGEQREQPRQQQRARHEPRAASPTSRTTPCVARSCSPCWFSSSAAAAAVSCASCAVISVSRSRRLEGLPCAGSWYYGLAAPPDCAAGLSGFVAGANVA